MFLQSHLVQVKMTQYFRKKSLTLGLYMDLQEFDGGGCDLGHPWLCHAQTFSKGCMSAFHTDVLCNCCGVASSASHSS